MNSEKAINILSEFSKTEKKTSFVNLEKIISELRELNEQNEISINCDDHVINRYVGTVFFYVKHFISNKNEINIYEQKHLMNILSFVVSLAILPNLIKGVALISNLDICLENDLEEEQKFNNLSCAIDGFMELISISVDLKTIIIKSYLRFLLSALYQLCYAPLQKPNTINKKNNFMMTENFYMMVTNKRVRHLKQLTFLFENVNKVQIFQQLMMLLYKNENQIPPIFFRRIITENLGTILIKDQGLKSLIISLISETKYDTGKHWNSINMIAKLLKTKHSHLSEEDYFNNISLQILDLLKVNEKKADSVQAMTALACIKELFKDDSSNKYANDILKKIIKPLKDVSSQDQSTDAGEYSIENSLDCLYLCFIHECQWKLDIELLEQYFYVLYNIYLVSKDNLKQKTENILYSYLITLNNESYQKVLDILLKKKSFIKREKNFEEKENNKLKIEILNSFILLLENRKDKKLLYQIFNFILKTLCSNSADLFLKSYLMESLMSLFKKPYMQDMLMNEPDNLLDLLETILEEKIKCAHLLEEDNDIINICLTILSTVIQNSNKNNLSKLIIILNKLKLAKVSPEINLLIEEIEHMISKNMKHNIFDKELLADRSNSRCSKAFNDVVDPLLPVRAHGILELGRLIEENDVEAVAKKYYILCILQENLKDEDSYIYLAAIKALTEVSRVCPEEVIELLIQEYLENQNNSIYRESQVVLRLKVGEALVKLISNAEKEVLYQNKTIFLNTFLNATHDDDFLVRSSAFSNLGELCNSLGNDLGSEIIFQILNKVEFCIENEKSPEVKRSSILLCTQLLRGLQQDQENKGRNISLLVLKPSLTPLLRALKLSYENNDDKTLKLHAQLAIEELENIIKDFFKLTLDGS